MNKWLIIGILALIYACSPRLHQHFQHTQYVRDLNIHIVNDSLQMYFKTPADINYETDPKAVRKTVRKSGVKLTGELLAYGKTQDPPYEIFITISPPEAVDHPQGIIVHDTLVEGKIIRFIGNPLSQGSHRALATDLKRSFRSLKLGDKCCTSVPSIDQRDAQ